MEKMLSDIPIEDLHKLVIDLKLRLEEKNNVIKGLYDKISEIQEIFENVIRKDELVYASKRELEMIFDASDDYIVILDKDYNIKRANLLFCNLINKDPKDVVGTKFSSYFGNELKDIDNIEIPRDTFIEKIFYSNIFQKTFLLKSRKLQKDFEPLVYIHITKDITNVRPEC